jgi:hypothetical protein
LVQFFGYGKFKNKGTFNQRRLFIFIVMSGIENESGQPRKRVRKSGWDIPGPIGTAPVVGYTAPSSLVDDIGESNAAFLAQQIALQRAQQAALLIPVQGGIRTGHRIYVG